MGKVSQLLEEPFPQKRSGSHWQVCQAVPENVLHGGCPGRNDMRRALVPSFRRDVSSMAGDDYSGIQLSEAVP